VLAALRQRDFALLWAGQLVSIFGDLLLLVALPYAVYERTGSALATGAMFMAQAVPRIALGSVAGVFADRWDRRRTMVISDIARGFVLLLLVAARSPGQLWLIYVVAAVQSVIGQFFVPARNALIPRLIPPALLPGANALNALGGSIAGLLAPPLGGLVMAALGLDVVVLLDSASFFVAAGFVALVSSQTSSASAHARPAAMRGPTAVWREWAAGLRTIAAQRTLAALFCAQALLWLGNGVTAALFVVFLRRLYGAGALELGWWLTAQGAGASSAAWLRLAWPSVCPRTSSFQLRCSPAPCCSRSRCISSFCRLL
jgi:MFS family permease